METYFCSAYQAENFVGIAILKNTGKTKETLDTYRVSFVTDSKVARDSLAIFKTLSLIEERNHTEVSLYHECDDLFEEVDNKHPQLLALENKIKRLEKKGFIIQYFHFNEKKIKKGNDKDTLFGFKTRVQKIAYLESNESTCRLCEKTKKLIDFAKSKHKPLSPRDWCQDCEDKIKDEKLFRLYDLAGNLCGTVTDQEVKELKQKGEVIIDGNTARYVLKKEETTPTQNQLPVIKPKTPTQNKVVVVDKKEESGSNKKNAQILEFSVPSSSKNSNSNPTAKKEITNLDKIKKETLENLKEEERRYYQNNEIAIIDNHNLVVDFVSKKKAKAMVSKGICTRKSDFAIQLVENSTKQRIEPLTFLNIKQLYRTNTKIIKDLVMPYQFKKTVKLVDRNAESSFRISAKIGKKLVDDGVAIYTDFFKNHIRLLYDQDDFKLYIKKRDRNKCVYCNTTGDTIEHKIAKSNGGLTTLKNCACACEKCNTTKSNLTIEDFATLIGEIQQRA